MPMLRAAAAAAAMNGCEDDKDGHGQDIVMPGFRFHPTEEELVEFYLRRKVEGKRFNVELITFLDLYHYDPWELPALAAIGEKEWFFYVPRDRKYRNGDRPNRVSRSGYWKATGADRMIRSESCRSIGLKKTLVFYSGKAPKGVRTSWIMNEYRLPQTDKDRYGAKAEISLCRVYKRAGVDDHRRLLLAASLSSRPSSSGGPGYDKIDQSMCHQPGASFHFTPTGDTSSSEMEKMDEAGRGVTSNDALAEPVLRKQAAAFSPTSPILPLNLPTSDHQDATPLQSRDMCSVVTTCSLLASSSSAMPAASVDELNRIAGYNECYVPQTTQFFPPTPQPQPPLTSMPSSLAAFTNKLWEWNSVAETTERGYTSFKYN